MKFKTHSGAKKRVKVKKRIVQMQKASKRHLLINKSKRQKHSFEKGFPLQPGDRRRLKSLIPHL